MATNEWGCSQDEVAPRIKEFGGMGANVVCQMVQVGSGAVGRLLIGRVHLQGCKVLA